MTIGNYQEQLFGGRSYNQGLFEASSTQKHPLGLVRPLLDGRIFVYAKAGASNLAAAKLCQGAAVVSNHLNQSVAAAAAVGAKRVSVTLGATAATANQYKDGFLYINDAAGEGNAYKIRGHKAIDSGGTGWIELYDAIRVALTTSSEYTLAKHPQDSVVIHPSPPTAMVTGVPPIAVTAKYYFWNQVKGPAMCLVEGTIVTGKTVVPSATTDGAIAPPALTEGAPNTGLDQQICGRVIHVNASTEYALIWLDVPGY